MNYSEEIERRLGGIFLALLDLVSSKKFLVALGTGLTGWYQSGDVRYLVAALLVYIGAQGVADIGKEKEKEAAKPLPPADDILEAKPFNPDVPDNYSLKQR